MASLRIIQAAVDRRTADPAHKELLKFVQVHCPGIVQKEQGKVFYFDAQLERKTPELQIASAVVDDFLSNTGRVLAADFLGVPLDKVKCERSFVILYCSRQTERTTRGGGQVTIFLALGDLSLSNGLPKIRDTIPVLNSGDTVVTRSQETQTLGVSIGRGIALVSDWS